MKALGTVVALSHLLLLACAASSDEYGQSAEIRDDALTAGLAYTKRRPGGCHISFFDPGKVLSTTLATVSACPELLFASTAPETIYFVLSNELHYIHLAESLGHINKLPLPDDRFESYRAALKAKPSDDYFPPSETNRLSPKLAGTLSDGRIAVVMSIDMPADDSYAYLFVRDKNNWRIEDQKGCHRFEYPCSFDNLKTEISYYYERQNERNVWSLDPANNRFLISAASHNPLNEFGYPIAENELQFEVNGVSTLVTARGNHSAHGLGIYTYSIRIVADGRELRSFSTPACGASAFDQFFLVHPCSSAGDGQLYDLETGEVILDSLQQVVWVN